MEKQIIVIVMSLIMLATFGTIASAAISGQYAVSTKPVALSGEVETESVQLYPSTSKLIAPAHIKLTLSPTRQVSEDGTAIYKVLIEDMRPVNEHPVEVTIPETGGTSGSSEVKSDIEKTYRLSFHSEQDIKGSFDFDKVTLSPGEKEIVLLNVKTEQQGSNVFSVIAKGETISSSAIAKGILFYGHIDDSDEGEDTPSKTYFVGKGFAINHEETKGLPVEILILDDKVTGETTSAHISRGKLTLGSRTFLIEDISKKETSEDTINLEFSLSTPSKGRKVGEFSGTMKKLDNILLLRGDLEFTNLEEFTNSEETELWTITAFAKREQVIRDVVVSSDESVEIVQPEKTIAVEKDSPERPASLTEFAESKKVYITPIKIKEKKFLGIFPTGKKILEVEVASGSSTRKAEIDEFETAKIEDYEVEVGSLADEDNIELTIKEAE